MSRSTLLTMACAALLLAGVPALAGPQVLQYQGRLTGPDGEALHGPVDVTFALYAAARGGEPLWSETFGGLALDQGRFSVLLGEQVPLTAALLAALDEGQPLHLGIRLGGGDELTPRQRIGAVVLALRASFAERAAWAEASARAARADTAVVTLTEVAHVARADRAARADSAGYAAAADRAVRADSAGWAAAAAHADLAGRSGRAAIADHAAAADRAARADTAEFARSAAGAAAGPLPAVASESVHRVVVEGSAPVSVVSITVATDAPGYLLLSASGTLVLDNTSGKGAACHANIGEERNGVPETTAGLAVAQIDERDIEAHHYVPFHCQRVVAKPAGVHTFHLNVRNTVDEGSVAANRPTLTALFVPRALGGAEALGARAPAGRAR